MSIFFESNSGLWWCKRGAQGRNEEGVHYDYAPAALEEMSQISGVISSWCRRHADGYRFAPAASFPIREGRDASASYHYDPVTVEEGDDDDDSGYDYAPAA
ncbi:hypothetical protein POM88_009836 [Heracleum sosnowskyi]|uniref:Uncharacterized protein n=1 Tax=Heracleum sosnowskyi TaxID=360622 RepID=A0AAD8JBB6_9APIA|nr:hypothetical protein POM88_009836 [Heracleum sosnowskyi]